MFRETQGRKRHAVCDAWNTKFAGKPVGHVTGNGYIATSIFKHKFAAHRIIWKLCHGVDPECVDHINRQRRDNRLCNLRNVAIHENAINQSLRRDNVSGCAGVFWHPRFGRWMARIKLRRKEYAIGRYASYEEAVAARKEAEIRLNFAPRSI
jgi:hypothetical protein